MAAVLETSLSFHIAATASMSVVDLDFCGMIGKEKLIIKFMKTSDQ